MVLAAAEVCEDKKGTEIRILELDPLDSGFTDFFLIASATNTRQTGAIADESEMRMKREFGQYARSVEGRRTGEWILLDYTDFVVHIFTEQTREFYDIERLRKSARSVDVHELASQLNRKTAAARKKVPPKDPPAEPSTEIVILADALEDEPASKAPNKTAKKAAAKKAAPKKAAKKAPAKKAAKKAKRPSEVEDLSPLALPAPSDDRP